MAGEDFVQVQMSAAGVALAGAGAEIRVENSRSHFHFTAGAAQRVVKSYEWGYLAKQTDAHGQPLFELVPSASGTTNASSGLPATADQVASSAAVTAQLAADAAAHEAHTSDSSQEHS